MSVEIIPLSGIPEVDAGDDLGELIVAALPTGSPSDGDVVVVTQKAISKAEDRLVPEGDPRIDEEVRRVVARRGDLVIAETRHGFVCANAGADRSNVPPGVVSLLPEDPDGSAERIRTRIGELTGRAVAVVVTDTFGRPWRRGLVNVAIGCAGLPALVDLRGTKDAAGRVLEATVEALADEISAAAGLVMAKDAGVPAALVRGVKWDREPIPARALVRPAEEDLFRESPLLSISSRRSVRTFGDGPVPREVLLEAVAASLTAPVPHGSRHRSRPWLWVGLERKPARERLLGAMADAWRRDLTDDGLAPESAARRIQRSQAMLAEAPVLLIPALRLDHADDYPDERRRMAEREMFLLATGAAVQNLMLALHAQGFSSCWVSSTLFCKDEAVGALGLDPAWLPMGAVAAGPRATQPPSERGSTDPSSHLLLPP